MMNEERCPKNIGAMFVPYSPRIVAHALEHGEKEDSGDWVFKDEVYTKLGYNLIGNLAA